MSYEYITVETRGHLTIVTINRPSAHNALNTAAHIELASAFDSFQSDDDQWVAIITGSGTKAFCAGHDLKQQAAGGGMETSPSGFGGLTQRFDLNKPIIAAVNGVAMGGGFEIALACDIVVASATAYFALPETRVGLVALAGGMFRLPRMIGLQRAMSLLLTGRQVSAQEGLELGFVTEVATGDLMEAAERWADMLLACSPVSVRVTKAVVNASLTVPVSQAIVEQWDYEAIKMLLASEDAVEGPRAFAEKRMPVWRNK